MVAVALAWVLVPLLQRGAPGGSRARHPTSRSCATSSRELDADLATGVIPREQYEQAVRELEQRVLEDVAGDRRTSRARRSQSAAWTAAILGGALPIAALAALRDARQPRRVRAGARRAAPRRRRRARRDAARRSRRWRRSSRPGSRRNPTTRKAGSMLARTYYAMKRHAEAASAFERAVALVPGQRRSPRRLRRRARRRRRAACAASRSSSSSARSRPTRRNGRRSRSPAPPRSTARTTSRRSRTGSG